MVFICAFLVGVIDIALTKFNGVRLGEIFLLLYLSPIVLPRVLTKKNIWLFYIALLFLVTLLHLGTPNFYWAAKLFLWLFLCSVVSARPSKRLLDLIFGLLCGWTAASFLMVITGSWFEAKYVLPQIAIFLASICVYHKMKDLWLRNTAVVFFILGVYVAFSSNSRGQVLLASLMLVVLVTNYVIRIKKLAFLLALALPLIYLFVGSINFYFLSAAFSGLGELIEFNAGDLERSTTVFYALNTIVENPFGQAVDQIRDGMGETLSMLVDRTLETISTHNLLGDSLLYTGFAGAILMICVYVRFIKKTYIISETLPKSELIIAVMAVFIISYLISTSPVAGMERVQVLYCTAVLAHAFSRATQK